MKVNQLVREVGLSCFLYNFSKLKGCGPRFVLIQGLNPSKRGNNVLFSPEDELDLTLVRMGRIWGGGGGQLVHFVSGFCLILRFCRAISRELLGLLQISLIVD